MKTIHIFFLVFFIISCAKEDHQPEPCNGECNANQICINNVCECKDGYIGPDCSELFQPIDMTITQLKLTSFPPVKPNGNPWDIFNNPPRDRADLLFVVLINDTTKLFESSIIEDANPDYIITWSNLNIVLEEPVQNYKLAFYDSDALSSNGYGNSVGEIEFTPYTYTPGVPPTFLAIKNDLFGLLIDVSYTW